MAEHMRESAVLHRVKHGYTTGARELASRSIVGLAREGGRTRPSWGRRPRLTRGARRSDHDRARLRAVGRPAVGDLPAHRDRLAHRRPAHPARPHTTHSPRRLIEWFT